MNKLAGFVALGFVFWMTWGKVLAGVASWLY